MVYFRFRKSYLCCKSLSSFQLLSKLHDQFTKHQGLHVDTKNVEHLPVSQLNISAHIIQCCQSSRLLSCSGPAKYLSLKLCLMIEEYFTI